MMASPSRKQLLLRLTPDMLEDVRGWADRDGKSMNKWVTHAIEIYLGQKNDEAKTVDTFVGNWWEKRGV